ncbi:hypothetical protein [Amycolatopsis tucumanensis]|uniref:Uncharacterized protein n=1 Tax=Amycolatopsis tucumanensis TaxID=401106 RepID=A0ABP7HJR4_9PSEU|nr:hypothetical protein [Amycolatopsis tucumanensis]MCF6423518.1 hypothetical protein [Amycolatopsis tucumanensis]
MMNTLIELQHLAAHRPSAIAPPDEVAAWYRDKALLHQHLALESREPAIAARERLLAGAALRRAAIAG